MKKRFLKKATAVILSLSLALSAMSVSVFAEDDAKPEEKKEAEAKENPFIKTGTTFSINKLYSTGLALWERSLSKLPMLPVMIRLKK